MENASKALIMAAEILIGVMIISIGVYLFNSMGEFSSDTSKKIEDARLAQFNNQFLKFYGTVITEENGRQKVEPVKCTIHDIIALANLARKENEQNGFNERNGYEDGIDISSDAENNSYYYIQIDLKFDGTTYKNIETMNQEELIKILKENDIVVNTTEEGEDEIETKYFKCESEPIISNITNRVDYMKFVEFK